MNTLWYSYYNKICGKWVYQHINIDKTLFLLLQVERNCKDPGIWRQHDWSTCFSSQCTRFIYFYQLNDSFLSSRFCRKNDKFSIHEVNLFIQAEECFSSQFCLTDSTPFAHVGSIRTLLLLLTNERRERLSHKGKLSACDRRWVQTMERDQYSDCLK